MATKRDFYEILGVPKNASDDEIKKSYRKLAMKFHPDRNQGDASAEVKFKEAKEAYEMLSDAEKRAAYDQFGHAGVDPNMRGGPGGAGGFGGFGESFGDIFGDIFGQTRRQQGAGGKQVFRGNDLSYAMDITLEEAALGKESQIRIPSYDECTACDGTGAKPGTSAKTCGTCQGQGVVQMRQGFFSVQQTCPHCRGSGKTIADPCTTCHGQGKVKKQKTLEIKIPAGIDDGMRIRSTGNGEPGTSAKTCGTCQGQGVVQMRQGFFSVQQTCPHCRGSGKIISDPCSPCHGQGKIKRQKTLEISIPAGIDDGMRIRSTGNGEPGTNGGPPGDLYIEIRLQKHEVFQRDGDDLHCAVPISFTTAALGGEVSVPTLNGDAAIDLPEGTQTGKQFRLRGKGIKGVRASFPGDLYCHITVETPVKLTEHQRKLLKELDESLKKGGAKHSPTEAGWADKLKNLFS